MNNVLKRHIYTHTRHKKSAEQRRGKWRREMNGGEKILQTVYISDWVILNEEERLKKRSNKRQIHWVVLRQFHLAYWCRSNYCLRHRSSQHTHTQNEKKRKTKNGKEIIRSKIDSENILWCELFFEFMNFFIHHQK